MWYHALACDYDGTIAHDGRVDDETTAALGRLRATGRRLILVTGRELRDLRTVCPNLELFDRIVAENGAVVYCPGTREEKLLGETPPEPFVRALRERGVSPVMVGRVIVATWKPHEIAVLEVIRDLGLELHVTFNKAAVMVLPAGLSKATGLAEALRELGLSAHNVVGVGDAENDHALLHLCECRIAVANALPILKDSADLVTQHDEGAGVRELIERLLADDLRDLEPRLRRHDIVLGVRADGTEVLLQSHGTSVLLVGSSGSGKSTLAAGLLEHLAEFEYQFCVVDPEGDYSDLTEAIVLGDSQREPIVAELFEVLAKPGQNVVINLLGIALERRPAFFHTLWPQLQQFRAATGRPHWLVVDEAHHLLPASWHDAALGRPPEFDGVMFITVHPQLMAAPALSAIDMMIAVGRSPETRIRAWSEMLDLHPTGLEASALEPGEALAWTRGQDSPAFRFRIASPRGDRRRHRRKYAEGEISEYHSFYFRGPQGKLNLRAQNLNRFLQLGDTVDDTAWLHHLRRGDYSRWFRDVIHDEDLAAEAGRIERDSGLDAQATRAAIRAAVEQRYTHSA
jgi:hydroxymethylpyrimidine pyrophosphatase-like HAD family hydrolase/energy-coupling factor transporter ATP-binding protein EcfA2